MNLNYKKKLSSFRLANLKSKTAYLLECVCVCACVCVYTQSCPTLCRPIDSSPPGSSIHGIFQARILERVAMLSSRGSFQFRDQALISYVSYTGKQVLYHQCHLGGGICWRGCCNPAHSNIATGTTSNTSNWHNFQGTEFGNT